MSTSSTSNLCNLCGLSFREEWQLRNHTQKIHDDQILKCNICKEEVIGKYRLASHKNKHRQKACSICFKLVPTNSYTAHRTKCDAQVLFCDHCPYQTPKTALLKKHQKSMHEEKEPKSKKALDKILHVCPHCKKSFKMKKHLAGPRSPGSWPTSGWPSCSAPTPGATSSRTQSAARPSTWLPRC